MVHKRPRDDADDEATNQHEHLLRNAGVDASNPAEVLRFIAELGAHLGITAAAYKKARRALPSFSRAKWQDIAGKYNLSTDKFSREDLPVFRVSPCMLPPSLHISTFESFWRASDVYHDHDMQTRKAARVRVLETFLIPLIALFRGRVIDKSGEELTETDVSSGGEVEHQVYALGDALFLVIEVELIAVSEEAHAAQLFSNMLSNASTPWKRGLRIHGLITDHYRFDFYSFDPNENLFARDDVLFTTGERERFGQRMILVTNKIFGILFAGYIAVLEAQVEHDPSKDVAPQRHALVSAREARDLFSAISSPDSCDDLQSQATAALEKLEQSVLSIPRHSAMDMLVKEPRNDRELHQLAKRQVSRYHEDYMMRSSTGGA